MSDFHDAMHNQGSGAVALEGAAALAQHDRWLRTVVASQLREPQAVQEVMQDVAAAAVARAATPARWAPWLYRVAVRQALLYRRRQGRERRRLERYARMSARASGAADVPGPLGLLLADERRALIRAALARLRRKDVEILMLKYTEGWSYRELAARLGATESAVEARLYRARSRLRSALAALDVIEVKP